MWFREPPLSLFGGGVFKRIQRLVPENGVLDDIRRVDVFPLQHLERLSLQVVAIHSADAIAVQEFLQSFHCPDRGRCVMSGRFEDVFKRNRQFRREFGEFMHFRDLNVHQQLGKRNGACLYFYRSRRLGRGGRYLNDADSVSKFSKNAD